MDYSLEQQQSRERLAGLLLIAAAAAAIIATNSPLRAALPGPAALQAWARLAARSARSTSTSFVVDGLMAVFFLLVGLEVKREWFDGRLATPARGGCRYSRRSPEWRYRH